MASPDTTDGATDPATDHLALLRREVGTLRAAEQRRRFPTTLHVGALDGHRTSFEVPATAAPLDRATAFDLLDCRLGATLPSEVDAWITRPGVPDLHDQDLLWLTGHHGGRRGARRLPAVVPRGDPHRVARRPHRRRAGCGCDCGSTAEHPPGQSQVWTGSLVCIRSR